MFSLWVWAAADSPLAWAASTPTNGLHGLRVVPRTIDVPALPRITGPWIGPIQARPEAINEALEEELEELKAHPRGPSVAELGASFTLDSRTPSVETQVGVGNGFEGISQGGFIPSEPTSAAGPLNVFTAGNVSVTITNKDGSNRVEIDGQTFFGVLGSEGATSDAQCYYDAVHGRFVALCFTQGQIPTNYNHFYLAISKTNDARGQWWLYVFDMTVDGTTQTTNWSDYQALGISEDKLAFSGQQFSFGTNSYQYQKIRILDRVAAYNGAPLSYVDFVNFSAPSGQISDLFVTKVGRNLTAGDATIHCLCVRTNGGSNVTYRTVTGPPNAPVLSAGNIVNTSVYNAPPDAVQKNSSRLVETNDCRPPDFYIRNGVLICAWHTGVVIGGNTVSGIRLFRMNTLTRAVLTDETFGAASSFYYYPAVTVDSLGTIFLGFDVSSSSEFPSAYATGKRRTDVSLQPSTLLKAGVTATNQTRWGDYTGIDNDASLSGPGGSTAWYAGQWTKTTNTFGTWINRLTFTYGQVAGTVLSDCDGDAQTAGDRTTLAGVTLTLKQGGNTLATAVSDAAGHYNFGYLETGVYDVQATPPASGVAVDAIPGSGGNGQVRVNASSLQVDVTNAQTSSSNTFLVTSDHLAPVATGIAPAVKNHNASDFSLTVTGSAFSLCSVVQFDGAARPTTWVSANELMADIPSTDLAVPGQHAITVFTPPPAGGTSSSQTFIVSGGPTPIVHLSAPVGGEVWKAGSTQMITWVATDSAGIATVDLAYSTDGGASFPNPIAIGAANTGSYPWTVADTPTAAARVRVFATDAAGATGSDSSHADFTIDRWTIVASAGAHGAIDPSGSVPVADGATPTFTMTPDPNYVVYDVLVNGASVGAVASYPFPPVHGNQTIAASFVHENAKSLSVSVAGNGSVTKDPDQTLFDPDAKVTLTAVPAPNWVFTGWSGDASGTTNPLSMVMDANKAITATFLENAFVWNQTGTADWGTATNWTPTRTTPATDDVLLFNGGGAPVVTGVPAQTIGQLRITNGTAVTLQPPVPNTLSVSGGPGADLVVDAGSTLTLDGLSALNLALGAGATASVSGTVRGRNAAHRLNGVSVGSIVFHAGSLMEILSPFSGSVFGTGTGTSALNSVVFESGATLAQSAGTTPFGPNPPNSVLTYQPGSRFRLDGAVNPSLAGRTYADFEYNRAATVTLTATSTFSIDSLIVTQGVLTLGPTASGSLRGDITVRPGATLTLGPVSGSPVYTLNGVSTQTVNALGALSIAASTTLQVVNPAVALGTDFTLTSTLVFAGGRVTTGANTLVVGPGGLVTGASEANGWVIGHVRRSFAAGSSSRTFDVGDARYGPVTVAVTDAAAPFDLTGTTQSPDHPALAASMLDRFHSVNRWWTLTPSGSPSFTSFAPTFTFATADVDSGAVTASFVVGRYDGAWTELAPGARTAFSTQATGVTAFGDFVVAEPVRYTLGVTVVGGGSVAKSIDQPNYAPGTVVSLTANPGTGWQFTGWSGDATGAANPLDVTLDANKLVTAAFADTARPLIAVTFPNGGESFANGNHATLTWTATDNAAVSLVDLLISRAGTGGPYDPIVTGIPNTGSYDWIVTDPVTSNAVLEAVAHDAAGNQAADASDAEFSITGTVGVGTSAVVDYDLGPMRPNPLRDRGYLGFALPAAGRVSLVLLDLQGREVQVLADGVYPAGRHDAVLGGRGKEALRAGLYFARLEVAGRTFVRRIAVTR